VTKKTIVVKKLIWDGWNVAHIARHNVIPDEIQEVCDSDRIEREAYEHRIFLIGPTKEGRMLSVILEPTEEQSVYKPITAFAASKRSIQDYQEEKKQGGEAA
jgi:uncharacterized DUF497 family protein